MNPTKEIKLSVRNLVEFVLRSGDLDTSFKSASRAVEGTKAHQKIQKSKDESYEAEVPLKHRFEYEGFTFIVEGRADGIIKEPLLDQKQMNLNGAQEIPFHSICVDEIKSTTRPLESINENYNKLHWAQAKCYAYIYCLQNKLNHIDVQLTYFHLETELVKNIRKSFDFISLEKFFYDILKKYIIWANFTAEWQVIRDHSAKCLVFPFENYRMGQRQLAISVYKTIKDQNKLFVQAPTGIGKTISTLFPTVKAFSEGHTSKLFYLTAKTITRQVVEEAFAKMCAQGLRFKTLTLTAKDKICFQEKSQCNPDYCSYAKGHFNRVNDALLDILNTQDALSRPVIEAYAQKHHICPFEFSLDLAAWADGIICDFNYVFDPRVYLRRMFDLGNNDYTFLIDEAHNLVDRAREMFSATLYKKSFLDLGRTFKEKEPKIAKALNKLNRYMLKQKKRCENENFCVEKEMPDDLSYLLNQFMAQSEIYLATKQGTEGYEDLLELFFEALTFVKILELYDHRYMTYVEKKDKDVKLKIFCLDPSYLLSEAIKRGRSAVFFSATLSPIRYFKDILGGNKNDYAMRLSSPFNKNNLCLMIATTISTRYNDRENSYSVIASYIKTIVSQKKGNYLVFFPSYQYMRQVHEIFITNYPEYPTMLQDHDMLEEEREAYLGKFQNCPQETLIGFAVMGGIFSEGIDLKGDRLIGSIIIGVGLPQVCLERNIIKDYFNEIGYEGFHYAYTYPGMNKVLQAAGRVIRTEKDKGIILLIDERYGYASYRKLFPNEWSNATKILSEKEMINTLETFYSKY
ncbi:ATP-dependent DNA helicase [Clostridiaceae bacterium 35-E11]